MKDSFNKLLNGYQLFRDKYVHGDQSIMQSLSYYGQQPCTMVVSCCDSRVDPALILQCDPGDLFVVRNVANIIPPYEKDEAHHGTSAALEFGVCFLKVKNLILLGHSQCGGIQAVLNKKNTTPNDFISSWVSLVDKPYHQHLHEDEYARLALNQSYQHCLTFPWLKERVETGLLNVHRWYFNIEQGEIYTFMSEEGEYKPLSSHIK